MNLPRLAVLCVLAATCAVQVLAPTSCEAGANPGGRTYYFSTSGDDRNDGRSPETPKASLALIPSLMEPGTSVLLKRGDVWDASSLVWDLSGRSGTAEQPLLVADYGDPARPRPILAGEPRIVVKDVRYLTLARLDLRGGPAWRGVRVESGARDVVFEDLALSSEPVKPAAAPAGSASVTTYYFSTSGHDANDGLSAGSPKKSLGLVPGLLAPGVTVLFKRGDVWHEPYFDWSLVNKLGTAAEPIRLGAYGDAQAPRPILASLVRNDIAEWTHEGGDVYSVPQYDAPGESNTYDQVLRLYVVDPVTRRGTPLSRAPSIAALTDNTYCVDSDRIYVRRPGFTSALWVESLQRPGSGYRGGSNLSYLTIEDLEFRGSATGFAFGFMTPTDHVTIRNCSFRQFLSYGISFGFGFGPATDKHTNLQILDTQVDRGWSPAMDYELPYTVYGPGNPLTLGANGGESTCDGIILSDAVDGAVIRGCSIAGMGHSGIGLHAGDPARFGVRNVLVEQDTVTAGGSGYLRGLAASGPGSLVSDITVRRCYFYDLTVATQLAGERLYVYSNVFERLTQSALRQGPTAVHLAGQLSQENGLRDCVIANNVFHGAESMLRTAFNGTVSLQNDVIANNLFVDWRRTPFSENGHAIVTNDEYLPELDFLNNGFWDESVTTVLYTYFYVPNPPNQSLDVAGLNALANSDANQFADPQFVGGTGMDAAKFVLAGTSPYRAGGVNLTGLLPSGMPAVDFLGNPFGYAPSRGAFQAPWTPASGVAILGTPPSPFELGDTLNLSAQVTPSAADIASYAWTIRRDGVVVATGSSATFVHTPATIGTYVVSLTAIDQAGTAHVADPHTVSVQAIPDILATTPSGGQGVLVVEDGASVTGDVTVVIQFASSVVATRNGAPYGMSLTGGVLTTEGAYSITAYGLQAATLNFSIDRTPPVVSGVENGRSYNTDRTIHYNEGVGFLNGAPFASGQTVTAVGSYSLVVRDAANNTTTIGFSIDRTPPQVSGVIDGTLYTSPVSASFDEGTATLDGAPFTSGSTVSTEGTHVLVVTDAATNTTTVTFTLFFGPPTITALDGRGNVLANGGVTDTTVTITLTRTLTATLTYNGSTNPLTSGTIVSTDGAYTVTANGTSTVLSSFTIRRVPTLVSPAEGELGVSLTPMFTWTAPPNATSYRLQVSTSSSFSPLTINQAPISGTFYQVPNSQRLKSGKKYYWRVNATGPGGTTAWSTPVRSFTTR